MSFDGKNHYKIPFQLVVSIDDENENDLVISMKLFIIYWNLSIHALEVFVPTPAPAIGALVCLR